MLKIESIKYKNNSKYDIKTIFTLIEMRDFNLIIVFNLPNSPNNGAPPR